MLFTRHCGAFSEVSLSWHWLLVGAVLKSHCACMCLIVLVMRLCLDTTQRMHASSAWLWLFNPKMMILSRVMLMSMRVYARVCVRCASLAVRLWQELLAVSWGLTFATTFTWKCSSLSSPSSFSALILAVDCIPESLFISFTVQSIQNSYTLHLQRVCNDMFELSLNFSISEMM